MITDPAAVYAPSPTVSGATSIVSEPIRTWSPISVRCLATVFVNYDGVAAPTFDP